MSEPIDYYHNDNGPYGNGPLAGLYLDDQAFDRHFFGEAAVLSPIANEPSLNDAFLNGATLTEDLPPMNTNAGLFDDLDEPFVGITDDPFDFDDDFFEYGDSSTESNSTPQSSCFDERSGSESARTTPCYSDHESPVQKEYQPLHTHISWEAPTSARTIYSTQPNTNEVYSVSPMELQQVMPPLPQVGLPAAALIQSAIHSIASPLHVNQLVHPIHYVAPQFAIDPQLLPNGALASSSTPSSGAKRSKPRSRADAAEASSKAKSTESRKSPKKPAPRIEKGEDNEDILGKPDFIPVIDPAVIISCPWVGCPFKSCSSLRGEWEGHVKHVHCIDAAGKPLIDAARITCGAQRKKQDTPGEMCTVTTQASNMFKHLIGVHTKIITTRCPLCGQASRCCTEKRHWGTCQTRKALEGKGQATKV